MADAPLVPEDLTPDRLPAARRGYDRKAVAALLEEASRRWVELRDHHDEVIAEIERRGGVENLGRDLREVGERVASILGDAQAAADEMRGHAVEEARQGIDAAREEADEILRQAEQSAFGWRRDAWETSLELLDQVQAEAEAMVERAESDVLIIRARAEQEAHRHLNDARKEAGDLVRAARYEAERLVGEAQRRAEEISTPGGEPGDGPPMLRAAGWGVTVIGTDRKPLGGDPAVEIDPHHPAYGDVLAAEVSSLREREMTREVPVAADPAPADEEGPGDQTEPADPVEGTGPEPPGPSEPDPGEPDAPDDAAAEAPASAADEVGSLFERLRRTDEIPAVDPVAEAVPAPVEPPEEVVEVDEPPLVSGPDPVELRERMLLPVLNEHTRAARRKLVDLQNDALDDLRTLRRGKHWDPDVGAMTAAVRGAVDGLPEAAVAAGGTGAAELGAVAAPGPGGGERSGRLLDAMAEAMAAALTDAAGAEDPAAEVGRLFRHWRNDEVERWVRTAGYAAYHDALLAGLAASGVGEVVGVRHGRLCRECPAGAGSVWDPAGDPPDGLTVPPAHLDCACTVEPHA